MMMVLIRFFVCCLNIHSGLMKNEMIISTNCNIILFIWICSLFSFVSVYSWFVWNPAQKSKYYCRKQEEKRRVEWRKGKKKRSKKTLFIRKYPLKYESNEQKKTKKQQIYILILSEKCKGLVAVEMNMFGIFRLLLLLLLLPYVCEWVCMCM